MLRVWKNRLLTFTAWVAVVQILIIKILWHKRQEVSRYIDIAK